MIQVDIANRDTLIDNDGIAIAIDYVSDLDRLTLKFASGPKYP